MVITIVSLVSTPAVDIGAFRSEGHDALSLYLGHGLYHDPAGGGYTGLLYTPLLPVLVAGLDELGRWNAWPVLITVLVTAALAVAIGRLAVRAAGGTGPSTLAGAAGIGGLAVWLVTSAVGLLYLGWSDELAWMFALGGLLVGARARGPRAGVVTVVLFTLAFWSKQTTVAAALAYAVWLVLLVLRGQRSLRFTVGLLGSLLATNLVGLGLLALATGGWEFYFNFTLGTKQAQLYGPSRFASDLLQVVGPPALWALALCAAALGREWRPRLRLGGTGALLALFVLIGVPFAMYFRSKQGGNPNQYFGVIWALGGIAALAWGVSRRSARAPLVDGLVLLAMVGAVVATAAGANRFDLRNLRLDYGHSIPADLRALAGHGGLFSPVYTDLTPGQVYPDVYNASDLLASGDQPTSIVRALVARRFEYAVTYSSTLGVGFTYFERYASAYGAYEANYFWKLDRVIEAGYGPAAGLPADVLERRPGSNQAAALAACFSPFRLAGETWTIRLGGGLWCQVAPGVMAMRASPSAASELVTESSWLASGTLRIRARPGAVIVVRGGGGWGIYASRGTSGWTVATRNGGVAQRLHVVRGVRLSLDLGGGTGLPVAPDRSPSPLSIVATPARGVLVDTTGLHLRP